MAETPKGLCVSTEVTGNRNAERRNIVQSLLRPFAHTNEGRLNVGHEHLRGSIGSSNTNIISQGSVFEVSVGALEKDRLLQAINIFDAGEEGGNETLAELQANKNKGDKRKKGDRKKNKRPKSEKEPPKPGPGSFTCRGRNRVKCQNKPGKIVICHRRGSGKYKLICLEEERVSKYLSDHRQDYCGKCKGQTATRSVKPCLSHFHPECNITDLLPSYQYHYHYHTNDHHCSHLPY